MPDRTTLMETIAALPDEAFSWLLLALAPKAMLHGANTQVWPDGLGGFQAISRTAIADVQAAVEAYVQALEAAR